VSSEDQLVTNEINTLDQAQVVQPKEGGSCLVTARGQYKVVAACLEF
jgi:hypothetical protein